MDDGEELMRATNEQRRRQLLAIGSALSAFGGLGVVIPLLNGWTEAFGSAAFPVGFLVGLTTAIGTSLALLNLRPL